MTIHLLYSDLMRVLVQMTTLLMLMSYLVVAFAGLVLAVQPRPDESAGDR